MNFRTRKRWKNDAGNQRATPLRRYAPSSIQDLVDIIHAAEQCDAHVRAVGSAHSWSDVAVTPDFLVEPQNIATVLQLDTSVLKPGLPTTYLVEVESGITLSALDKYLDDHGLALKNMGGYDGQTIAGVTATSTHGSGLAFGPITEMIQSFDVVDGLGRIWRVERTHGPTDPGRYGAKYGKARTLISDDRVFNAVAVGLGCFGLIYSVIIEVTDAFWLNEVRCLTTWEEVKGTLATVVPAEEHYELLINPHAVGGTHRCLVTTRTTIPPPTDLPPDRLRRNFLVELAASFPIITGTILRCLFNHFPKLTPKNIDTTLENLVDKGYANKSFKVFNIGKANDLPSLSAEYGFSFDDGQYIAAIDHLLQIAAENAACGNVYQTGALAVRFVRKTDFMLSPQYGQNTVMVEAIVVSGTIGAEEMLFRYEEAAYRHEGRPHWGQINHVACMQMLENMYPRIQSWLDVRRQFDPTRRFDSPFTRRIGI